MDDLKKMVKIMKVMENFLSDYNVDDIIHDYHTIEKVFTTLRDQLFTKEDDRKIEYIIATYCKNKLICNGDWDLFLNGEEKPQKAIPHTFKATHEYRASVIMVESKDVESYLPSLVKWDLIDFQLDLGDPKIISMGDMNDSDFYVNNERIN